MSELEGPELADLTAVDRAVEALIGHTLAVAETLRQAAQVQFRCALDTMTGLGECLDQLEGIRADLRKERNAAITEGRARAIADA